MTAQTSIPQKWYVPFANGDTSRVELPVTTADPTRASQTLGFPPLTMQPPESGGAPPQGEDFNGGMNQIARVAWWSLLCGGWPYDATFATNSNIGGYPKGATLQSADFLGNWISTIDNNQNNPDTNGTGWVPGFQYGSTPLTGLTGGTVILTPLQAAKGGITLAGTLTSALTVIVPAWLKNWTITNSTSGAFVVVVKTLAGSGVTIPQNGAPTVVRGDGTNINQIADNIAQATSGTQSITAAQAAGVVGSGRNVSMYVSTASASATLSADEIIVETALGGIRYCLPNFSQTINLATTGAGGMDTGTAPVSGYVALYAFYNPTTGARTLVGVNATSAVAPNVYGGANAPSGYTASALVSVWPTNASSQFAIGNQVDRSVLFPFVTVLTSATVSATPVSLSIASAAPKNARKVSGSLGISSSVTSGMTLRIFADSNRTGLQQTTAAVTNATTVYNNFAVPIVTQQTVYYDNSNGAGTPTFSIVVTSYDF